MRNSIFLRGAALLALATGAGMAPAHAQSAPAAVPPPPPPPTFQAAPSFRDGDGGFTFKVRGRMQYDIYSVDADFVGTANDQSYRRSGLRRARLGVEGQMTPKFRYQAEATILGSAATWEELRLEYVGKTTSVFIGNTNTFEPEAELTSSRLINFNERPKWTEAFGTGRFAGIGAVRTGPNWSLRAGVQGDSINNAEVVGREELLQYKIRGTWAPIMERTPEGANILHLGLNLRYRDAMGDSPSAVATPGRVGFRYRARPQGDGFGDRFIDTDYNSAAGLPAFSGDTDILAVAEVAYIRGPILVAANYAYSDVEAVTFSPAITAPDATFTGGNVDLVWNLTGESHNYRGRTGDFTRTTAATPITVEGGHGLIQLGVRYDNVTLTDGVTGGKVRGGTQNAYVLALNWFPIDYVGFKLNYAYNDITGGDAGTRTGDAQVVSLRTQFDF
jgi:phosphate-selective porin OprO and OprP